MSYVEFANTDQQKEVARLMEDGLTGEAIAEKVGKDPGNVRKVMALLKQRAAPKSITEHSGTIPDGYQIKGTSTLYKDGEPALQWVKTNQDAERQLELMKEAISSLSEDLPRLDPESPPDNSDTDNNLMAVYPLGDPHIGVLTWGEETGQNWDLKTAEKKFCKAFSRLVKTAPQCDHAVIVNLGDYFHADNMEGVTTRSGNSLDVDTRFAKMIRVGFKIMRQMIDSALSHHRTVKVINATGNHDDTSSLFLSVALANMYESEPRVIIDESPTPFHYVEWGKCMFGVHHGHSCKPSMLPGVMAADQPKMWGRTEYRYWYTGHIHHDTKKEYAGVTQESFRTLAAKDAYATWGGYRSGQDSKCIVLDKRYGEVERHTVNLAMI